MCVRLVVGKLALFIKPLEHFLHKVPTNVERSIILKDEFEIHEDNFAFSLLGAALHHRIYELNIVDAPSLFGSDEIQFVCGSPYSGPKAIVNKGCPY